MHKVLVFTQFQLVLDELEKYCQWRGWRYMRLDGSTNKIVRELDIREFSSLESRDFVFLICTRAGGVGINLVTANHVVMYDQDWNPFVDLQAIDRAHRIGQKRDVNIYRLMTEWTVEERMAFRRSQKMKLDKLVVQAAVENAERDLEEGTALSEDKMSSTEIRRLLVHGRSAIVGLASGTNDSIRRLGLQEFLDRPRNDIPEIPEPTSPLDSSDVQLDVVAVDDSDESRLPTESPTTPDTTTEDMPLVGHHYNDEGLWRSSRQKRQAKVHFVQESIETKSRVERRLLHDKKCFVCAKKNAADDQIVQCGRCPKVYHLTKCLGLEKLPAKSWSCHWHECCLCFRKGSGAGGMLLHCAECPTAFCFDCFPPEYRRYHAPPAFWSDLQKKGLAVSEGRMALFLCSRCKAVKEQERRKQLSAQQLASEVEKQREASAKAKIDAEVERLVAAELQKDAKRRRLETKATEGRKLKETREVDKHLEAQLRDAYQTLWPVEYCELVKQRNAMTKTTPATTTEPQPDGSPAVQSPTIQRQLKLPAESLNLCENCRLPLHPIASCPFPPESVRCPVPLGISAVELNVEGRPIPPAGEGKMQVRQFCAICGVSSRIHTRKLCPKRPEGTDEETERRRTMTRSLIVELGKEEAVCIPTGWVMDVELLEDMRRRIQPLVGTSLKRAASRAGLPEIQMPTKSQTPEVSSGIDTAKDPPEGEQQNTLASYLVPTKKRASPSDDDRVKKKRKSPPKAQLDNSMVMPEVVDPKMQLLIEAFSRTQNVPIEEAGPRLFKILSALPSQVASGLIDGARPPPSPADSDDVQLVSQPSVPT